MQLKSTIGTLLAAAVLVLATPALAQDLNYKQADDFADWLVADGQFSKAAGLYAEAFEERARNVYAYKAAELYFYVKNYAKAAKFYEAVAKATSDYPDARLKYARSLKRMGNFEDALTEYTNFTKGYVAADSATMRQRVNEETAGVELALAEKKRVDPTIFVDRISAVINGMKNEIAPQIMADGSLTFISDFDGTMRAYSSERAGNAWTQMRPSPALPVLEDGGHIAGGTLVSKDRYVFGLCPATEFMAQPAVRCSIQEITRRGGEWGAPRAIAGNINVEGVSSTHPFIFEADGKEVMIFASDRPNGFGGLDLWKAERNLGSDVALYGTPVNLGATVNGPGNEVTPFFDQETRILSFSSDGGITLGGYDVFHATATEGIGGWTTAINPGTPINSTADDYHYRTVPGTTKAFLASNRSEDLSRTIMTNDDLYTVSYSYPNIAVELMIVDDATGEAVSDPTLTVSLNPDGFELKPMIVRRSLDGFFKFSLPTDRDVTLDVIRPYFDDSNLTIRIPNGEKDGFQVKPIRIDRTPVGDDDVQVVARVRRPGSTPERVEREVMTATGEEEEGQ